MLWFVVPVDPGISWEGHLSGLLVGLAFAFIYKQKIAKPAKFDWEKPDYNEDEDAFMKHFDENGNFIEKIPDEGSKDEAGSEDKIIYKYFYRRDQKDL